MEPTSDYIEKLIHDYCDARESEGFEKGCKAAWEAARAVINLPQGDLCKLFPEHDYDNFDVGWINDYSASEVMERLQNHYIKFKLKNIKFGDDVYLEYIQV